jgi:hydrogenase maturation protein HypF
MTRHHFAITGIVQGVGFRPFVYRLATELNLSGWVRNTPAGVEMELQGAADGLDAFSRRLQAELPPLAVISSLSASDLPALNEDSGFAILPSSGGRREAQIAPDSALCPDCRRELLDPDDRRFHHPFITCTNCGPRWTIVTGIPYDRPLTTMAGFPLCPACGVEYRNPLDRRFHAQPIACPDCGPRLSLIPHHDDPLGQAIRLLQQGQIVAVKGLGGCHLAVDACSDQAVVRLRQLKQRDEKPFAVMVADLATARQLADLSKMEERLLFGPEAPIVIVRSRADSPVSALVAPGSQWIGLILAYTPLHQLLFADNGFSALVMTSANASDEPMISDDQEALDKLSSVADAILTHDRPIHVRTDDSVLRVFQGRPLFYRRSRGYVPRPVLLPFVAGQILAVGAELKNTICLTRGNQGFVSQHIGDLKNAATLNTFRQTINHLSQIMEINPELVVCDLHPDYLSTRYAEECGLPLMKVQHHHAHLASCMAENQLDGDIIGIIFDGTGLGEDGTIRGGEFLVGGYDRVERFGHLKQVRLLGGDAAAREPWRMVLSWLNESLGDEIWQLPDMPILADTDRQTLQIMLQRGLNAPQTSSVGRLFDAAALLVGAACRNSFDGQAGMAIEALAESTTATAELQSVVLTSADGMPFELDCTALLLSLAEGQRGGVAPALLARGFHASLADSVTAGCCRVRCSTGLERVVLSGGVFQNRLLSEMVYTSLSQSGFKVFVHHLVPPNDGGIALGQAAIAAIKRG